MRVAIDVLLAERQPGGMLFAVRALLEGLARIDQSNEYIVITGRPDDYHMLDAAANMRLYPVRPPTWKGSLIQHQLLLPLALRRIQPDLTHITAFAGAVAWRGPTVVTAHDLAFLTGRRNQSLYARLYWEQVLRHSARHARQIIAVSEQTRDELATYWSVNPERITVVHNALRSMSHAGLAPSPGAQRLRATLGASYLLHVGRIVTRKNVEQLVRAYDLLAGEFPDLHLALVGGAGYGSAPTLALIAASPYRDRIHLLGWVSDDDLAALYAGARVFVFPSLHEGFGLPLLEAMACGVPVVASYAAAHPAIVGSAALRVDGSSATALAHGIAAAMNDPELRATLSERGRAQAQSFSPEACARATLRVYEAALAASLVVAPDTARPTQPAPVAGESRASG